MPIGIPIHEPPDGFSITCFAVIKEAQTVLDVDGPTAILRPAHPPTVRICDPSNAYLDGTDAAMGTVMIWAGISCTAFLIFFGLLILGLLQRSNNMVGGAVVALAVALGSGIGAVLAANNQVPAARTYATSKRSGMEIYRSMFGPGPDACVSVTHYRDRLVPRIDKAIRIRARICGAELKRINATGAFRASRGAAEVVPRPDASVYVSGEFAPEVLGDTVWCHRSEPFASNVRSRWIYMSLDSSEMIAVDMME